MHIFTYGSLMISSVMQAVTGSRFTSREALLRGYARFSLQGASYPGLVPQEGTLTEGVLYLDVTPSCVARLDAFEGAFYDRVPVTVEVAGSGRLPADVYIVTPPLRHRLSADAWYLDDFRREHLAAFLASYHGFSALDAE